MAELTEQPAAPTRREEAELVRAMARGDKAALGELYDRQSAPLYSLAYRIVNDAAEAQDLVQDVFLQAWRSAASYDPARGSVFTWLATPLRNRAIDRIRMRRRRSELLAAAAPDLQPAEALGLGESVAMLAHREKATAVRTALAELAPDQQQAIELAYFGGLTQQEIAEKLSEPLGTIKARIRRGLLKLKEILPSRL